MKMTVILLVGLLMAASASAAFAHFGDGDSDNSQSSPYGPVQSATVAVIDLKVPDYETAREDVTSAAIAQGAKLTDLHTWVDPKGRKHGWIRFTFPSDRLTSIVPVVYAVGKLYSEKMTTSDYKSDSDQLGRRIASLSRHEARLNGLLNSNRRLRGSDLLYIQERLFRADVDEGMLDQQRIDMAAAQGSTSLQVELFEPGTLPVSTTGKIDLKKWFAASLVRARFAASRLLARAATAGAYLLIFAPIWAPAVLIAWLILWLIWRQRRRIGAWFLRIAAQLRRPIGDGMRASPADE